MANQIEITLKRSLIGKSPSQREALRCLGLKKIHQTKVLRDHPAVWGQIKKITHLVEYKKVSSKKSLSEASLKKTKGLK